LVRRKSLELLNSYIQVSAITEHIEEYVVSPRLGDNAGVLGAIALASIKSGDNWRVSRT